MLVENAYCFYIPYIQTLFVLHIYSLHPHILFSHSFSKCVKFNFTTKHSIHMKCWINHVACFVDVVQMLFTETSLWDTNLMVAANRGRMDARSNFAGSKISKCVKLICHKYSRRNSRCSKEVISNWLLIFNML